MNQSHKKLNLVLLIILLFTSFWGFAQTPPTAVNDTFHVIEKHSIAGNVSLNDMPLNGTGLVYNTIPITLPNHGIITNTPNGTFTYTPNQTFTGIDSFDYEVCNITTSTLCDTATAYIHVLDSTFDIITTLDTIILTTNSSQTINVLSNDYHTQGLPLKTVAQTGILDTLGNYTADPAAFGLGIHWRSYIVCEQGTNGRCQYGQIMIQVNPLIVTMPDNLLTGATGTYQINVLTNDVHNNGGTLITTPQTTGGLTLDHAGNATIDPTFYGAGVHLLAYQVCDAANPSFCETETIQLTITSNNSPVAVNDTFDILEGLFYVGNLATNDFDPDNDALNYTYNPIISPFIGAAFIDGGTGNIFYTPAPGFVGIDSCVYEVCDLGTPSLCDTAAAYFNVRPFIITPTVTNATNCNPNNGSISIATSADTAALNIPFEYSIDSGATWHTHQTFINLGGGSYHVMVRDSGNIYNPYVYYFNPVVVSSPSVVTVAPTIVGNTTCVDGTSSIQFFANATNAISYVWTGPLGFTSTSADPIIPNIDASLNGIFTVTVTDINGCTATESVTLYVTEKPIVASILTASTSICLGESLILTGNPYAIGINDFYSWTDGGNGSLPINTQMQTHTITATPIDTGIITYVYSVTINGCQSDPDSIDIMVLPIPQLDSIAIVGDTACADGTGIIQLVPHPISPSVVWIWSDGSTASTVTLGASALSSATYSLTIVDVNGCTNNNTVVVNITDAPTIDTIYYSYDTVVIIPNGNGNYEYSLDSGLTWQPYNFFYSGVAGVHHVGIRNVGGSCSSFMTTNFISTPPVAVADTIYSIADTVNSLNTIGFNLLANDYDAEFNHLTTPQDTIWDSGQQIIGIIDSLGNVTYNPTTQWLDAGNILTIDYEVCEIFNPSICDTSSFTVLVRSPLSDAFDFIEDTIAIGASRGICLSTEELRIGTVDPLSITFIYNTLSNVITDSIVGNRCLYLHGENYGTDTTYAVIFDDLGFSDTITIAITVEDGVWSGDTDDNTQVDNFDLLNIGLAYGATGTARDSVSIIWDGYITPNWGITTANNIDYRHIDCNGDGIINSTDTMAIIQNWGNSYQKNSSGVLGGSPIFVQIDTGYTIPNFSLPIVLGDMSNPAIDVYGGAFSVDYDTNYIKQNSVYITFDSSWIGTQNLDMISIQRNAPKRQQVDAAFTRINGTNITGYGTIASLNFTIKDDILQKGFFGEDSVTLNFKIFNTKFISVNELEIPVDNQNTDMTITKTNKIPYLEQFINVFPNPATNEIQIESHQLQLEAISLISTSGRVVHHQQLTPNSTHILEIGHYPSGVYMLRILTSQGVAIKRITIVR